MRANRFPVLALALVVVAAAPARAMRRCGDDVDGHGTAVACECGDVLVSSRTLGAGDPVTVAPCRDNGLLVDARGAVTLTLGGRTIAGSGQGVGITVLHGTLALAGPGTIVDFGTGVLARGAHALGQAVGIRVAGNRADGFLVSGDGYTLQGCTADGNGRDGFALGGGGYALDGNAATTNGRYGFTLAGTGAHVGGGLGNTASGNGRDGFWLGGGMHQLLGATAVGNRGDGIGGALAHAMISGARADANGGDGLKVFGPAIALAESRAAGNRGVGISVIGPAAVDSGGNQGSGNGGRTGATGTPAVRGALLQCRVNDRECR